MSENNKNEPQKTSSKAMPRWLWYLIPGQAVVIGILYGYFVWFAPSLNQDSLEPVAIKVEQAPSFKLDPFIVNLRSEGQMPHYLKVDMSLELANVEMQGELENQIHRIRNRLIFILSSKRPTELSSPESKELLQNELRAAINQKLTIGKVAEIYFSEFTIH
jgi:flagellar basal body-associated protein FliL